MRHHPTLIKGWMSRVGKSNSLKLKKVLFNYENNINPAARPRGIPGTSPRGKYFNFKNVK